MTQNAVAQTVIVSGKALVTATGRPFECLRLPADFVCYETSSLFHLRTAQEIQTYFDISKEEISRAISSKPRARLNPVLVQRFGETTRHL